MNDKKIYTIFAGVNGAGKSTLFNSLNIDDYGVRLNSDEIINSNGDDWRNMSAQILAGKEVILLQRECLKKQVSFNQETTLTGTNIIKTLEKAKALGYIIDLHYVGVNNSEIAKKRVEERIKKGGHGVDFETIDRRFVSSLTNLKLIIPLCDTATIYDNSNDKIALKVFVENGVIKFYNKDCIWINELIKQFPLYE